jgi:hypothetical protein
MRLFLRPLTKFRLKTLVLQLRSGTLVATARDILSKSAKPSSTLVKKGHQMKIQTILIAAALALGTSAGSAQTAGDWVLANYRGAGFWFPGIIQTVGNGRATILYDDGDRETLPLNLVRPYDWMIGSRVECNFRGQGNWYAGTITSLAGASLGIAYDDGDRESTVTGRCRSR